MKDLPRFQRRSYELVWEYASQMLTQHGALSSSLHQLIERDDHSFRAVFDKSYFLLLADSAEPTKSQWNNLKKRFKRSQSSIFLFKEHGTVPCGEPQAECYFLDFGFLPPLPPRRPNARPWQR